MKLFKLTLIFDRGQVLQMHFDSENEAKFVLEGVEKNSDVIMSIKHLTGRAFITPSKIVAATYDDILAGCITDNALKQTLNAAGFTEAKR